MATQLLDRRCRVVAALPYEGAAAAAIGAIGGAIDRSTMTSKRVEVENMRVQFRIRKDLSKKPNTGEIVIFNLAERSRQDFNVQAGKVALIAGYRDVVAQIFYGDITRGYSVRESTEWATKIEAGDGQRAIRHGRVSRSFAGGVPVRDVARACAAALGLDPGDIAQISSSKVYDHGYAAHGRAADELTRVLSSIGAGWSVQDGRIQLLAPGGATAETIALLSPQSGIIGTPEFGTPTKKGGKAVLRVKTLLLPGSLPGRRVRVEGVSGVREGLYRALVVEHAGDTHSPSEWFTTQDLEAL